MKTYRIVNKRRFIISTTLTLILLAVIFTSLMGLNTAIGAEPRSFITVNVESGDTLWDLARTYGPENMDIRNTVAAICNINDISAAELKPGMHITIPTSL